MTDAGFFRGTSADQDNRFANKQKKLLEEINYSPILNTKLNMSKIDLEPLQPWIVDKMKEILEKDDELLSGVIYEHLTGKNEPDGKDLLVVVAGFVGENQNHKTSKFMEELWTKLIDIQTNKNGVSPKAASADKEAAEADSAGVAVDADAAADVATTNAAAGDDADANTQSNAKESSKEANNEASPSPQRKTSRSVSKSPEVPRKSKAASPEQEGSRAGSKQKSPSKSRSASAERSGRASSASSSRSRSRSPTHSGSRPRSRSYSRSKSSSRSPRRQRSRSPRSPQRPAHRLRRSRSRSSSLHLRSRSPRARRGFGNGRGSYRGMVYDRRRPQYRRRSPIPWQRRGFSPRSPPLRRRRSPSPRERSRSPYYRRRLSPRSPPHGHLLGRRSPVPRHMGGGPPDMMRGRHIPHHDMHRPILPMQRSPRPIDHRMGYGERPMPPRHSPLLGRPHDLHPPHGLMPSHPGPSASYKSPSPSPSRKKHKKEKKHRKHKKSKKHRSASPERRKKHKKHKKSKKHKS